MHLLKDEFPEVRLNLIGKLEQVIGGKLIDIIATFVSD